MHQEPTRADDDGYAEAEHRAAEGSGGTEKDDVELVDRLIAAGFDGGQGAFRDSDVLCCASMKQLRASCA